MRKLFLIKRKREIIIEVNIPPLKKKEVEESPRKEITSIIMMSRRLDEWEEEKRKKMESEMIVFSCKLHSQKFLWSLIPSINKDRKC